MKAYDDNNYRFDNEPGFSDPLLDMAREQAEDKMAESDLPDEAFYREIERLTTEIYAALIADFRAELVAVAMLSPDERARYWFYEGRNPPTDEDLTWMEE